MHIQTHLTTNTKPFGFYVSDMGEVTHVEISVERRNELRRYKAQDGLTYDEAIQKLLENAGWYDE